MKVWTLQVTASAPAETDAVKRIAMIIALGRRLGLRIEIVPVGERPPRSLRSAKERRQLIQGMH